MFLIYSNSDCVCTKRSLYNYFKTNQVTVNISKCQCISFDFTIITITLMTCQYKGLARCETWGLSLSQRWLTDYIDNIIHKSYKNLGFVMRACQPFKDLLCHKEVYYAYVRSTLAHLCQIRSPYIYKQFISL